MGSVAALVESHLTRPPFGRPARSPRAPSGPFALGLVWVLVALLFVPGVPPAHGSHPAAPGAASPETRAPGIDRSGPEVTAVGSPSPLRATGSAVSPVPLPIGAWQLVPAVGTQPTPGRSGAAQAYDAADGYIVRFGGEYGGPPIALGDTWTYNGTWSHLPVAQAPAARAYASMVWDPVAGRVVLFGGEDPHTVAFYNDTWSFLHGRWTPLYPSVAPPHRYAAAMDWDGRLGGALLFGGVGDSGTLRDTWKLVDGNWSRLAPATYPSARAYAALTYDPGLNASLLFGGYHWGGTSSGLCGDTWEWQNSTWTLLNVSGSPSPRAWTALQYDPLIRADVLSGGGESTPTGAPGTYEFNGHQWIADPLSIEPPQLSWAELVFDGAQQQLLLIDGAPAVWEFYTISASIALAPRGAGLVPFTVQFTATPAGGIGPYSFLWAFGDGASANGTGANGSNVSHSFEIAGLYATWVTVADARGSTVATSVPITVYAVLFIAPILTPRSGLAPLTVHGFSNVSGGAPPVRVTWISSGVVVLSGTNCSVTFADPGIYVITMVATDGAGENESMAWTVIADPTDVPMTVGITASAAAGVAPLKVQFESTLAGGIGPYDFNWSFGDGGFGRGAAPAHLFPLPGTFVVTLRVTDSFGAARSQTLLVEVDPILSVAAGAVPTAGPAPLRVTFAGSVDGGAAPDTYLWTFGDGNASVLPDVSHLYTVAGTYNATLRVTDSVGDVASYSLSVYVGPPLVIPRTPTSTTGAAGGGGPLPGWIWIVSVAVAFVAGIAWAAFLPIPRRPVRRRPRGGSASPAPPSAVAPAKVTPRSR